MEPQGTLTAKCPCGWASLTYKRHGYAHKAADLHQIMYHAGRPNIIAMERSK